MFEIFVLQVWSYRPTVVNIYIQMVPGFLGLMPVLSNVLGMWIQIFLVSIHVRRDIVA